MHFTTVIEPTFFSTYIFPTCALLKNPSHSDEQGYQPLCIFACFPVAELDKAFYLEIVLVY